MDNTTVKLDKALLRRAKKLLKKTSQRIRYTNLKQFVNIAILKLLEEEEIKGKKGGENEK
ncbi:MAG: hypothetical protein AABX83_01730 [Nanoarchaeota archaeon]